uniref:Secreted protein n=1 Tax=Caenorhabditis tropicalis TaxID=1561998 RepID=A0A1I7U3V3_9PELO
MFKVAVIGLLVVLAIEATNLSCKSEGNPAIDGTCPEGTKLVGEACCSNEDVFDVDSHSCRSEPMPAIENLCPYGFILVADGCCPNSDAFAKENNEK